MNYKSLSLDSALSRICSEMGGGGVTVKGLIYHAAYSRPWNAPLPIFRKIF